MFFENIILGEANQTYKLTYLIIAQISMRYATKKIIKATEKRLGDDLLSSF